MTDPLPTTAPRNNSCWGERGLIEDVPVEGADQASSMLTRLVGSVLAARWGCLVLRIWSNLRAVSWSQFGASRQV